MKSKTILLLIFIMSIYVKTYCQKKNNGLKKEIIAHIDSTLEVQTQFLNDSLTILKKQIEFESLRNELNAKNQNLIYKERIDAQNDLIGSFGVIYKIITILISIIAIGVPIATYYLGILPSIKAQEELEKVFDKKFLEFMNSNRNNQIDQAIMNIKSREYHVRQNAISYLSINRPQGFSELQLFNIVQVLKDESVDNDLKNQIAFLLPLEKNSFSDDYFKDAHNQTNLIMQQAISYFASSGLENYMDTIYNIMEEADNKLSRYRLILSSIRSRSPTEIFRILNDKGMNGYLEGPENIALRNFLESIKDSWKLSDELYETVFMKQFSSPGNLYK